MPASFQVNNGTVDIRFIWAGIATSYAQNVIDYAALYDHNRGLGPTEEVDGEQVQIPFANLSNQQKLTMVFQAATRLIKEQAKSGYVNAQTTTAREDAIEYADEYLDLEAV